MSADTPSAARLLSASAVRAHCGEVARAVMAGRSPHFAWHEERLPVVAQYVTGVIRERYPDLRVPVHSRWRHFEAGGTDRWGALAARHGLAGAGQAEERARAAIDLVIPSVLLDAGAGAAWRFVEGERTFTRSEGLGIASLGLFASGKLSADARAPLRSDAAALAALREEDLARAFQVTPANPLVGLASRAALLARLGELMAARPAVFGAPARLGNLLDYWKARASGGRIAAASVLETLLTSLGDMWPGRAVLDGVALGDCWPHPEAVGGFVPFHKLSQWLAYSLLEPLADGGLEVTGLDALTGLPEYRNGGLLLDLGLVRAKDPSFHERTLQVGEAAVVEWRALTVVGLDRLAPLVREALGVDERDFPLARLLEGGTWAAGRKVAAERRAGGVPPVTVASDGTVF